ncbi:hypothetical protein NLG97_g9240 [Lecanicillium saksenae]|uniref:Uncharacterized protein n=1 Tax=Lecanicillium saksenae TaxID=468837 RepID=A0ACC1QI18_9HYPO|nr:hypothetical protein NLG97_g9240 [Lecanicillium saksenae]
MPSSTYKREELDPSLYTVAWIAPLEIETRAAIHMLDVEHTGQFPDDGGDYTYIAGEMCGHNVIIATFPAGQQYGTGSAAALASHIKTAFRNIRIGLLVGVAAGIPRLSTTPPRDIRLGDILPILPQSPTPPLPVVPTPVTAPGSRKTSAAPPHQICRCSL